MPARIVLSCSPQPRPFFRRHRLSVPPADSTRYINDVQKLAAPDMEGRGAGTKGLTRAEHLIEKRYKELHLEPAGVNGYAQPFSVITGAKLKSDNRCVVMLGGAKTDLKIERDFVPFSFSSSGSVESPRSFCGIWRHGRGISLRRLRRDRRKRQDCRRTSLRTFRICGQEREPRPDAAFATDHEGDQRTKSRCEGGNRS